MNESLERLKLFLPSFTVIADHGPMEDQAQAVLHYLLDSDPEIALDPEPETRIHAPIVGGSQSRNERPIAPKLAKKKRPLCVSSEVA